MIVGTLTLEPVSTVTENAVGRRVRLARESRGMDQSELARKAGVSAAYVNRLEIGTYKRPSALKLSAIAAALGLRLVDLTEPPSELPADLAAAFEAMNASDREHILALWNEARESGPDERASLLRFAIQSIQAIRAARPR